MKRFLLAFALVLVAHTTAFAGLATEWKEILTREVPDVEIGQSINSIGGIVTFKSETKLPEVEGCTWKIQKLEYTIAEPYPQPESKGKLPSGTYRLYLFPDGMIDET